MRQPARSFCFRAFLAILTLAPTPCARPKTNKVRKSMRRLCIAVLFGILAAAHVYADTQDNVVFRSRMVPDNEVPPIAAAGNSANAAITVRVTRDDRGNVSAATVTFDIDYTVSSAVTFTGLHIHNNPAGQNGNVVIDTEIGRASCRGRRETG